MSRTIHDLSVWNKPLIDTCQHCSTSRANQALRSLANAGFQNRGVCLQAFPSFPSPSPLFHFMALVLYLARSKPKIPFLGLFFAPKLNGNACYAGLNISGGGIPNGAPSIDQNLKGILQVFVVCSYSNWHIFRLGWWRLCAECITMTKKMSWVSWYAHLLVTWVGRAITKHRPYHANDKRKVLCIHVWCLCLVHKIGAWK